MKKFKRVIASICAVMMIMSTFAATTVAATPKAEENRLSSFQGLTIKYYLIIMI